MKDLASLADDASAIALDLARLEMMVTSTPKVLTLVAEVMARAAQMKADPWADLCEVALANKRFRATRLVDGPGLRYSPCPEPAHVPRLPPSYLLRVFRNAHLPQSPGLVYESMVDRLACAFLGHYFLPTHQFLLQPQHTFRRLAPADAEAL